MSTRLSNGKSISDDLLPLELRELFIVDETEQRALDSTGTFFCFLLKCFNLQRNSGSYCR